MAGAFVPGANLGRSPSQHHNTGDRLRTAHGSKVRGELQTDAAFARATLTAENGYASNPRDMILSLHYRLVWVHVCLVWVHVRRGCVHGRRVLPRRRRRHFDRRRAPHHWNRRLESSDGIVGVAIACFRAYFLPRTFSM
jgi:hypothetical protein